MRFGQYELLERVAVGGMAEVFRGRAIGAEGFEKWIAIKRVLPDLARDEAMVSMLLSEARIHAALSHRNIVQIHDLGVSEDGEYFIVLEYVEGHDLRAIIEALGARAERVPDPLALFIASEVAQGLHFAHDLRGSDGQALGLIHRDVSPSNILISFAGEVKLSDFGIAKRKHDASAVGTLKGNLVYMSPEQARRAPLDRRTDLFALGAVLFEMLTGYKLREIRDEVSGWREVASGQVRSARALRPELPEVVEEILMKALAAEPEKRYPDVGAFGAAIRALRDQGFTLAGPNDLADFVKVLNPPRRPRSDIEMSKIIRLMPEQTGRPPALPGARKPPPPPALSMPEPKTPTPEPHPGARVTGGIRATPSTSHAVPRPTPLSLAQVPQSLHSPRPGGTSPSLPVVAPAPPSGTAWPAAPQAPPTNGAPPPNSAGWAGTKSPSRPSLPLVPGSPVMSGAAGPPTSPGMVAGAPLSLPPPAQAPFHLPASRPRSFLKPLVFLCLALGGAALVHNYVAPLEVLAVWLRPTTLSVISEPQGAKVHLDGQLLEGTTPTQISIKRDRRTHVLELSLNGFQDTRQVLRYDRDLSLIHHVTMAPLGAPPPSLPIPAPPPRTRSRPHKK